MPPFVSGTGGTGTIGTSLLKTGLNAIPVVGGVVSGLTDVVGGMFSRETATQRFERTLLPVMERQASQTGIPVICFWFGDVIEVNVNGNYQVIEHFDSVAEVISYQNQLPYTFYTVENPNADYTACSFALHRNGSQNLPSYSIPKTVSTTANKSTGTYGSTNQTSINQQNMPIDQGASAGNKSMYIMLGLVGVAALILFMKR